MAPARTEHFQAVEGASAIDIAKAHRQPSGANAQPGIEGSIATAPVAEETEWAIPSKRVDGDAAHEPERLPQSTASSNSAPASSGMMTKVVSGMATMLAPTP